MQWQNVTAFKSCMCQDVVCSENTLKLKVYLFVDVSLCLFMYLFISLFICRCIYVHVYIYLFFCLFLMFYNLLCKM